MVSSILVSSICGGNWWWGGGIGGGGGGGEPGHMRYFFKRSLCFFLGVRVVSGREHRVASYNTYGTSVKQVIEDDELKITICGLKSWKQHRRLTLARVNMEL